MSHFQDSFETNATGVRVRFERGVRHEIASEIARLGCSRALVLSTPQQADTAMELTSFVNGHAAGVFTKAAMHTPIEVTQEAVEHTRNVEADCLVAIGGGSTTGLGKAIALQTDLPQIVIPTTYAGSEATAILGQTENGVKTTVTNAKVLPEVILYDVDLIAGLPVDMTVTSGLNAMAHAAEALYAKNRNPVSSALAVEGIRAFINALPRVREKPEDLQARGETLYGAWLCGTVLGQVGMALHHKLCHTLGGSFDMPHAQTHAVVLPHAIAFNAKAASDALSPMASMLGDAKNPGTALYDFAKKLDAPMTLAELGMKEGDLHRAAELAVKNPYWNPQPFQKSDIHALLENAFAGERPAG
ncbi:MAG: maleylacetate reductase [Pseudomonadota bacterium]